MTFYRTDEGKNRFISIDNRISSHNPLYMAWNATGFNDRDITLYFILLDILGVPEISLSLPDIMEKWRNIFVILTIIILPGDIRNIMNTVLIAKKRAQANVITRCEEVRPLGHC